MHGVGEGAAFKNPAGFHQPHSLPSAWQDDVRIKAGSCFRADDSKVPPANHEVSVKGPIKMQLKTPPNPGAPAPPEELRGRQELAPVTGLQEGAAEQGAFIPAPLPSKLQLSMLQK